MTIRSSLFSVVGLLAAIGLLALAPPAGAGHHGPGEAQAPSAAEQQFSEDELESFASAATRVSDINSKWEPQIRAAGNADEARTLRAKATNEMLSAIEDEGLTPQRYNAIVRAARADSALKNHILGIMRGGQ